MWVFKLIGSLAAAASVAAACDPPIDSTLLFTDTHDGDQKLVTFSARGSETTIGIAPGPREAAAGASWRVEAGFDAGPGGGCAATVDFRVPGKPGPPPVPLLLHFYRATAPQGAEGEGGPEFFLVFTDPSGTLADEDGDEVLNVWIAKGGVGEVDSAAEGSTAEIPGMEEGVAYQ